VGSATASALFALSGQSYVATFAAAAVPPFLALLWLSFAFRKEMELPPRSVLAKQAVAERTDEKQASKVKGTIGGAKGKASDESWLRKARTLITAFSPAYWQALLVMCVLYFARFDFSWVTLRAQAVRFFSLA
jgi:hypothetical protein